MSAGVHIPIDLILMSEIAFAAHMLGRAILFATAWRSQLDKRLVTPPLGEPRHAGGVDFHPRWIDCYIKKKEGRKKKRKKEKVTFCKRFFLRSKFANLLTHFFYLRSKFASV